MGRGRKLDGLEEVCVFVCGLGEGGRSADGIIGFYTDYNKSTIKLCCFKCILVYQILTNFSTYCTLTE